MTVQVKANCTQNFWLLKKMSENVDWVVLTDHRQDVNNPTFYVLPAQASDQLLSYDNTEKATPFLKYAHVQPYREMWNQLWAA